MPTPMHSRQIIADELAETAENRAYRQMSFAEESMRAFRKEMLVIADAPDLETVQQMAMTRARRTKNIGLVGRAKASGVWRDLGALKRVLIDDVISGAQHLRRVGDEGRRPATPRAEGYGDAMKPDTSRMLNA